MKVFFVNIQVKDPTWKYSGERSWPKSDSAEQRGRRAPFLQLPKGGNSFRLRTSEKFDLIFLNSWLELGVKNVFFFWTEELSVSQFLFAGPLHSFLQGFSMYIYIDCFSILCGRASQWSENRRPRVRQTARGAPPRQGCDQIWIFDQIPVFFCFLLDMISTLD